LEILKNEGRHISVMILPDNVEASGVNSPEQLMNLENELLKRQ
jgi:bifunctional N-acetylglucosamine-1-phosphate-uridyltransferase/glucosamine-1-phosphate-acetyltransferase GlmU-like protein